MSLERAHRFCIKFMQSLPKFTSTDTTLALIGLYPLEFETCLPRSALSFCGKWFQCVINVVKSQYHSRNTFCYFARVTKFRNVLWHKLIARFGFDFHTKFISLSASDQVNLLLSCFRDLLNVDNDRVDSMKIFLMPLKLLVSGNDYENKITL